MENSCCKAVVDGIELTFLADTLDSALVWSFAQPDRGSKVLFVGKDIALV